MKRWLEPGVAVGLTVCGVAILLHAYLRQTDLRVTKPAGITVNSAPAGRAMDEWKQIWAAGNPTPSLLPETAAASAAADPSTQAKLDRIQQQLEYIQKCIDTAMANNVETVTGMTLPSPHYLDHPPRFVPPSPRFALETDPQEVPGQLEALAAMLENGPVLLLDCMMPPIGRPIHCVLDALAKRQWAAQMVEMMKGFINDNEKVRVLDDWAQWWYTADPSHLVPQHVEGSMD